MLINVSNQEDTELFGIYCIRNIKNNKRYIGSTSKSFSSRWNTHIKELRANSHASAKLQKAYNKYSEDVFEFSILEILNDINALLDRERYYIEYYNSTKLGYNINPDPNLSPMLLKEVSDKVSEGMKNYWIDIKSKLSEDEYKKFCKKFGHIPWNKGKKMTKEQTINMHKPRINGISDKMKQSYISNSLKAKDRSPYYLVYDSNGNWINTFYCIQDLVEYSKMDNNNLPILSKCSHKGLSYCRIGISIKEGKLYKNIYLKKVPKIENLSYANEENSWKANEPIMKYLKYSRD